MTTKPKARPVHLVTRCKCGCGEPISVGIASIVDALLVCRDVRAYGHPAAIVTTFPDVDANLRTWQTRLEAEASREFGDRLAIPIWN